jgi:hypothetical protein
LRTRVITAWIGVLLGVAGCSSAASRPTPEPGTRGKAETGLEGTAYRGPTRPICRVDQPCQAPFSGAFEVRQNERVIARFRSDSSGHYLVPLPPGTYSVLADSSAPVLIRTQIHDVTIRSGGLTHFDLNFDSGIR